MAQPRHHTLRSDRPTKGGQVAKVAEAKRSPLLPWQGDGVDVALEYDPATGLYHYGIVVVSVPRQSGKTKLEGDVADHRCLTLPRARVWITMQNGKTVDEWMREEHFTNLATAGVFGVPGTRSCKYSLSKRAGSVGVKWPARGSTFTTFPPTREALHSKQSDLVFVDEAWAHDAERGRDLRQAIRPTMNTRPGSQLWIVSTEGDDSSEYLDDYITLARETLGVPDARVCFIDYGIADDADPEDLDAIAAAHPAYGHLIDMSTLRDARADFSQDPAGWARAYGNRRTRTRETAIPAGLWAAAARPRTPIPDRAGLALDVTPEGDRYALAAGWRIDGHGYVEVIEPGPPTRQTPRHVVELVRRRGAGRLIADRASIGAVELLDAIAREADEHRVDLEVVYLSQAQASSASGAFYRGVLTDTVHHFNQPDLDEAVEVAVKRDVGDGGIAWSRKHTNGSIAELISASLSLRAFDELPAPKRKPIAIAAG